MNDIFIHTEGQEKAAYQDGREVARMTAMGYERFLVALYRWTRDRGPVPLWLVDDHGALAPAEDIQRDLITVRLEQEGRS